MEKMMKIKKKMIAKKKKKKTTERIHTGGDSNVIHLNSEQNGCGNRESEGGDEGEEDTENDDNQEENGDKEEDEEERRRRATEKGKTLSEHGEIEFYIGYDADHLDVAILKSILDFNSHYGDIPHPPSLDLINHIMNAIPDLQISREELREKIIVYKENFNEVRELQGDNPDIDQPVDDEFFELCML
ncbi:hypothetical protein P3S67_016934 [Capsicum chacoense]